MANKKEKKKPVLEIKTRTPEKRGIFDNLGNDRTKDRHPLRDILDFPAQHNAADSQHLDNQNQTAAIAKDENFGYPNNSGLGSQSKEISYPNNEKTDSQANTIGNPSDQNLDSKIAQNESRLSKKSISLDSKIAEDKKTDSQTDVKKGSWAKYDNRRKSKGIFLRTNEEITKRFKQFCIEKEWDFSHGTEVAWNKLMTDLDIQTSKGLDSLIALDDRRLKMLYQTKPFIINLYLRYNSIFNELSSASAKSKWSARWTPRDDEAAKKYNDIDIRIIELGIIQTQTNKGIGQGRIQTFKYYVDEIENCLLAELNSETIDTILNYHRQVWQRWTGREIDLNFLLQNK